MCDQKVTFQIVVEDCAKDINLLNKTINSIVSSNYDRNYYGIVLSAKKENDWKQIPSIVDKYKQNKYVITAVFNLVEDKLNNETFCFSTYRQAGYYCKTLSGTVISESFFEDVCNNQEYDFVESEGICAIKSNLAIDNYLTYMDYDLMEQELKVKSKQRKKYLKL
jgi:hypothetical protein